MGVSLFPGVNGRRPEVEEIAADICTRLADSSSPQPVEERIRQALMRLVDGLTLEGGLFIPPAGHEQRPIAVGTALMTGRVIVEFLGRPRVQNVSSDSDMLLLAGAPHSSTPLPPDDQLHLSSLGVRTLMVLPLRRGSLQHGAIAVYSQRTHPQWDGVTLEPLMSVVE